MFIYNFIYIFVKFVGSNRWFSLFIFNVIILFIYLLYYCMLVSSPPPHPNTLRFISHVQSVIIPTSKGISFKKASLSCVCVCVYIEAVVFLFYLFVCFSSPPPSQIHITCTVIIPTSKDISFRKRAFHVYILRLPKALYRNNCWRSCIKQKCIHAVCSNERDQAISWSFVLVKR